MIRLAYGRMLQDGLDGTHGLPRARLAELAPPVRRGAGGGPPPARRRANTASTTWSTRPRPVREITRLRRGAGPGARSRARARHRRLGPGREGAAQRAPPAGVERVGRRGPRVLSRGSPCSTTSIRRTIDAALRRIDPRRVLVNVISKSGGTAETMAQYLVVRAWLEEALGAAAHRHLVFTTDPARGALREIAARDADRHARRAARRRRPVQRALAGGTAPRGPGGHRHRGAARRRAAARWSAPRPTTCCENPAALYAALHWAADT